jgi:hypothetical protein
MCIFGSSPEAEARSKRYDTASLLVVADILVICHRLQAPLAPSIELVTIGSTKKKINMQLWKKYFDIAAIRKLRRVAVDNSNNPDQLQFTFSVVTDGNTIGFQYARKPSHAAGDGPRPLDQLQRGRVYDESEVSITKAMLKRYRVIAVDPGSRTPLTLVALREGKEMRVTSKGYRDQAGINWHRHKQEELEHWYGMDEVYKVIGQAPSRDSLKEDQLKLVAAAFGSVWAKLWKYKSCKRLKKLAFHAKARERSWMAKTVNAIVNLGADPTVAEQKPAVIVFGNGNKSGIFGRVKKWSKGPIEKTKKEVAKDPRARVVVGDEFATSALCPCCGTALWHPNQGRCMA